jgi:hypothetical protein
MTKDWGALFAQGDRTPSSPAPEFNRTYARG